MRLAVVQIHTTAGDLHGNAQRDPSAEEIVAEGRSPDRVGEVLRMVDRSGRERCQALPGVKITPMVFRRDRRMPIMKRYSPGAPP